MQKKNEGTFLSFIPFLLEGWKCYLSVLLVLGADFSVWDKIQVAVQVGETTPAQGSVTLCLQGDAIVHNGNVRDQHHLHKAEMELWMAENVCLRRVGLCRFLFLPFTSFLPFY